MSAEKNPAAQSHFIESSFSIIKTSYLNFFTLHMQQTSVLRITESIFCSLSLVVKLKWRKYKVAAFPLLRLHSPPAWCVSDHSQPSPISLCLCRPPLPPTQFSMSQLQLLFLTQTLMQFKNTVCSPVNAISVTSTASKRRLRCYTSISFFCFVFQKCTLLCVYVAEHSCLLWLLPYISSLKPNSI